jgi:hypothetical protein
MAFRAAGTVIPSGPQQIGFGTAPTTTMVTNCSSQVLIQSQDGAGQPVTTATQIQVSLSSPSGLSFFIDPNCQYSIDSVTIGAGTSQAGFYFRTPAVGGPFIDANAAGFAPTSQQQTIF